MRDEALVLGFLERSGCFDGLVPVGWHVLPYSRELIASRWVRPGLCRGLPGPSGLAGLSISAVDASHGGPAATIVFCDAEDDGVADALFDDIVLAARETARAAGRRAAAGSEGGAPPASGAARDRHAIRWIVPDLPRLKRRCAAWGLVSWEREDDYLVYELPLGLLGGFAAKEGRP